MTDIVPSEHNRVANSINLIFHPIVICIPTLIILLSDLSLEELLLWTVLSWSVLLIPLLILLQWLKRLGKESYQRRTRTPLYLLSIVCILADLVIFQMFSAPLILTACFLTLLLWVPFQLAINTYVTKISLHTAVITGCSAGLIMSGEMSTPLSIVMLVLLVLVVAWARWESKNHTIQQVLLGMLVGGLPVFIVFPLVLG